MTTRPQQPPQLHGTGAASCGRIRATTDHTAEQVEDIHRHLFREGTD